ncbi:SMI1/KNR4 family protein [Cohnella sp.]|uniref:SMI1/KNR4 family protein n=1 Tax=Cohnella sp. TaxID=1883426 RepID=UPI0035688818
MEIIGWEFQDQQVGREVISLVEKKLDIEFPSDYVDVALKYHGGSPSLEIFQISGHGKAVFGYLLSYDPDSSNYILEVYNDIIDRLPDKKVIPFANDPFGNFICFDYRKDADNPSIVFWEHEIAFDSSDLSLLYVASSFSELLEMLCFPDENSSD